MKNYAFFSHDNDFYGRAAARLCEHAARFPDAIKLPIQSELTDALIDFFDSPDVSVAKALKGSTPVPQWHAVEFHEAATDLASEVDRVTVSPDKNEAKNAVSQILSEAEVFWTTSTQGEKVMYFGQGGELYASVSPIKFEHMAASTIARYARLLKGLRRFGQAEEVVAKRFANVVGLENIQVDPPRPHRTDADRSQAKKKRIEMLKELAAFAQKVDEAEPKRLREIRTGSAPAPTPSSQALMMRSMFQEHFGMAIPQHLAQEMVALAFAETNWHEYIRFRDRLVEHLPPVAIRNNLKIAEQMLFFRTWEGAAATLGLICKTKKDQLFPRVGAFHYTGYATPTIHLFDDSNRDEYFLTKMPVVSMYAPPYLYGYNQAAADSGDQVAARH